MRYKNIKTGTIIDSPSEVSGKNWVKWETGTESKNNEEVPTEEYAEEEIDLEEMTKKKLIELAKENKIDVNEKDTKPVIIEAIAKAFE